MAGKKLTCLDCAQVNRVPEERLSEAKCGTCGAKLVSQKAVEIDFATLQKAARNDELPLVVDFWAPWCGPCKMMGPEFNKAADVLAGKARLVKVNTEDEPKAGQVYGYAASRRWCALRAGKRRSGRAGLCGREIL